MYIDTQLNTFHNFKSRHVFSTYSVPGPGSRFKIVTYVT